ncbi:hypothetical protein pb186bvf_006996 [Paramecium bursaria]
MTMNDTPQGLQKKITDQLLLIKDQIESQDIEYLNQAIQELKIDQLPLTAKQDIISTLRAKHINETNFIQKLPEIMMSHMYRMRRCLLSIDNHIDSMKPQYIGELLKILIFPQEDKLIEKFPILLEIIRFVNEKILNHLQSINEKLNEIKEMEKTLLKQKLGNFTIKNPPKIGQQQFNFSQCLCKFKQRIVDQKDNGKNIKCDMCSLDYHSNCLLIKSAENLKFIELQGFICPFCTIQHMDPTVIKINTLVQPQYIILSVINNIQQFSFQVPEQFTKCQIQLRCLKIDGSNGIDEPTWPDYGQLTINNKIYKFEPLLINYALKKRKDDIITITEFTPEKNNTVIFQETKEIASIKDTHRISTGQSYVFAIYIVEQLTVQQIIQLIDSDPKSRLPVQQAKKACGEITNDAYVEFNRTHLTCQLSYNPIRKPARGQFCKHSQCFDLENYILATASSKQGKSWRCLVCKKKCFTFMIDSYQEIIIKVINQQDLKFDYVTFLPDGDISEYKIKIAVDQYFDIVEPPQRKQVMMQIQI